MGKPDRFSRPQSKTFYREWRVAHAGLQKRVKVVSPETKHVKVTPHETKHGKVTRSQTKLAEVTPPETKYISVKAQVMHVFTADAVHKVTEKSVHHFSARVTPFRLSHALETTVEDAPESVAPSESVDVTVEDASESVASSESVDVTVEDASESVDDSEAGSWVFCSEPIAEWDEAIQAHVLCDGMPCPFAW